MRSEKVAFWVFILVLGVAPAIIVEGLVSSIVVFIVAAPFLAIAGLIWLVHH